MRIPAFSALVLAGVCATPSASDAQIIISGNTGAGGTGTLTIVSDLTFTISRSASLANLVFDEWVSSDGVRTTVSFVTGSKISYELNGVPGTRTINSLNDNYAQTFTPALTANDGSIFFSSFSVTTGSTFVLKAGSWNFNGNASFNPDAMGTFTGNVFLSNGANQFMSEPVSAVPVPEPAAYGLLAGAAFFGLALGRRRPRATVAT